MENKTDIKILSWQEVEVFVEDVVRRIIESGWNPDYLVGVAVGGLVPLALISKSLNNKNIFTVTVSSYHKNKQGNLTINYLPEIDVRGKKLLLIDEIAITGVTLQKLSKVFLETYSVAELKTLTMLVDKNKCFCLPDFYANHNSSHIIFPWEKKDFPEYFEG